MAGPPASLGVGLSAGSAGGAWSWRAGDPQRRAALAPLVAALLDHGEVDDALEILREKPGRRRLARGRLASGEAVFVKHFAARDPGWKRRLRLTPAAREFRALRALHAAGVAVPEPLAWIEGAKGDELVITRFLPGEPLASALRRPREERRALLREVGALVRRLHASGRVHRDLHRENIWVCREGPVLIDLQQSLRIAPRWLRLRDQGELDASLAPLLSLADRLRLRAALLGAERPFDATARAALRAVGRASEARHRSHMESRTRRCLSDGRLYARFECELGRGMRLREVEDAVLRSELESAAPCPGARSAWVAGHGLRARGIGAPRPRGFVEGPVGGRVALEAAGGADAATPDELVALGVALRRHRVEIAALPRLGRDAEGRLGPLPLDAVGFPAALSTEQAGRIDAWIEREIARVAPDEPTRDAALRRYRLRLRFYVAETVTQRK
jgi:hypothetical protein